MYQREKKRTRTTKNDITNYQFEFPVTSEGNFNIELYNVSSDSIQKLYYIPEFLSTNDESALLELVH